MWSNTACARRSAAMRRASWRHAGWPRSAAWGAWMALHAVRRYSPLSWGYGLTTHKSVWPLE